MRLNKICFKVDKPNGKAMIMGFPKEGKIHRQSIWVEVRNRVFPALLTLQRSWTPFKLSDIGENLDAKQLAIPLKYAVLLDSEYFVKNELSLWNSMCVNGLFDIWDSIAPYTRLQKAKSNPSKFRIQLLRIYEIDRAFSINDIKHANTRIDWLTSVDCEVNLRAPVISSTEFAGIRRLLERTVEPYLTRPPQRPTPSEEPIKEREMEVHARDDIASLNFEQEFFNEGGVPRLSSYYERNPRIRAAAVRYHGTVCKVCEFDFQAMYGVRGIGYIEAHHLVPVSDCKESRAVDPISEMTVVCSNCHRMLHRKKNAPITPEQLKSIISRTKS